MNKGADIVIVNYYSKHKILRLLESINQSLLADFGLQVIIINNSVDEDLSNLISKYELTIINNSLNKGFGYACNQAIPNLKYNYTLLLNPDTILFKNTLYESINYMEENKNITALGIKHLNENKNTVPSCSRFPTLTSFFFDSIGLSKLFPKVFTPLFMMTDWNHLESKFVNQVMGAFIMIRKSFIDEYKLMDERFFVFLEDTDLCKRIWLNNGTVFYNANIALIHEGANSTEGVSDKKMCYLMEGKLKYANKYFNTLKYIIVFFLTFFVEPLFRLIHTLATKPKNVVDVFKGYLLFIKRHQFK